ncbi:MAG: hypothetical protein E7517_04735 [Ruminococcaceae bacterium]|nr:hypothetical protein [Oscillospiraceae bacterium]MBE6818450.1 hypothetical protein [Oscillospiraceae bacterium]
MKAWCKAVGMLLSVLIAFGSFAALPVGAAAQKSEIQYIFREWDAEHHVIVNHNYACSDYTELAEVEGNRLSAGCCYVVSENTTMPERLFVETGVVHLIVCDDTTLTLGMGIEVAPEASLSIYTQAYNSGKIYANINRNELPAEYTDVAIIGGGIGDPDTGDITIHGGILDLNSSGWTGGSVIGGAKGGSANVISIYGGTIDLHQTGNAALLGGGNGACGSRYQGEGIRIYGGILNAEGLQGSICTGIGSGSYCDGSGGSIAIYGGTIAAVGTGGAAGIGGGSDTTNPPIDIYGGSVTAKAGGANVTGAGIGTGCKANQTQPIGIYGGTVIASSHTGAGIGAGCGGNAQKIVIDDASVISTVSAGGAGIGGGKYYSGAGGYGGDIKICSGANVVATSYNYGSAQDYINRMNECISSSKIKTDGSAYGSSVASLITFLIEWFQSNISGCGIGGGYGGGAGKITISDSKVIAESGAYSAAIGTGDESAGSCSITIADNSDVKASAGTDAAAIGTGNECESACGQIDIYKSTVTARGGAYGAAIGGGDAVGGGNIVITHSTVNALGGTDAAGIGGGEGGDGGNIWLLSSSVIARGSGYGSGIGNGENGDTCTVYIYNGSTVKAWGGESGGMAFCVAHNYPIYSYHTNIELDGDLTAKAGNSVDNTVIYNGNSRKQALQENKYAEVFRCYHPQTQARWKDALGHSVYCTDCEQEVVDYERHIWSDNRCTVCGYCAEMKTVVFVEQNDECEVRRQVQVPYGSLYYLPECQNAPDGMVFAFWDYNGNGLTPGSTIEVQGDDITLTAVYTSIVDTEYIDENGAEKVVKAKRLPTAVSIVLDDGWYVVDRDMAIKKTLLLDGNVNLILADDATMLFDAAYDSEQSIRAIKTNTTLKVYGQREQTGEMISIVERQAALSNFEHYGGLINAYGLSVDGSCTLNGGKLQADWIKANKFSVIGGNAIIGGCDILENTLALSWTKMSDSLLFVELPSDIKVTVNSERPFIDESGNIYTGELTAEQVNTLKGQGLKPYVEHTYAEPEWIWADEYRNATAVFTCSDCGEEVRVKAYMTIEEYANFRISHAKCTFNGKKYEATHSGKILWDITLAQSEGGTLCVESLQQKAGRNVLIEVSVEQGYALETLTVEDSAGNPIEVKNNSFTMPESDVTVSARYRAMSLNITVGGVHINRGNCADILGNGTANYDFETNTLTLNNASLETVTYSQGLECAIRINQAADTPLTIHLEGANKIVNEHTDSETTQEYGLLAYDNGAGYRFTGSGSLDISMSAQNENISYCGIETRKSTTLSNAHISVNLPGAAKAIGYNMVYSNMLSLKDKASLTITTGANAQSYAMANNRNIENLDIESGCTFLAVSDHAAFNAQNLLTAQAKALGVGVNVRNQKSGMALWDGKSVLSNYKIIKIGFEPANNGVNLKLGSDITSNYYIDYTAYEGAARVVYTYNAVNEKEQNVPVTKTIDLSDIPAELLEGERIKLTVSQAPAQIAEPTHIEILSAKGEELESLDYCAKTYCDNVIAMRDETLAEYAGNAAEAARLKTLAHSLIAYAEAAQGVFADYETTKVTCESDAVKAQIAAATATANHTVDNSGMIKFSGVSFVCTKDARLRFYLNTSEATSTPAAPTSNIGNAALKYTLNGAEKQYFVEVSGINAADFNEQITVNYGGSTIKLSVLDFAGIVLRDGSGASAALQHFAKTLVVYNTNALAFFN